MVFLASFQSSLVIVDYHFNQDFYEEHCTNKDNPELECHGKCQVKSNSEKDPSIFQVAKFCFEFNFVPHSSLDFHKDTDFTIVTSKSLFSSFIDKLPVGDFLEVSPPPEV